MTVDIQTNWSEFNGAWHVDIVIITVLLIYCTLFFFCFFITINMYTIRTLLEHLENHYALCIFFEGLCSN